MNTNDAKRDAILAQLPGYTGGRAMPDLTLAWLALNGAQAVALPNAWDELFTLQGIAPGQHNDRWHELLGVLGYSGSLSDRERDFWLDGGLLP